MIAIACDHGAIELKNALIKHFSHIKFVDFGCFDNNAVDYPDYAALACKAVQQGQCAQAILLCGTGIGMSMAANKHKGIRAACCSDIFSAKATRQHNDANVLCLGARVVGAGLAIELVDAFLTTQFSGDIRHITRINKLSDIENI